MADNEKISEVSNDVLAKIEEPRENLISTAVKFLQNPKVQTSPLSQRRTFLEKKGLTIEEIDLAIDRSGVSDNPQTHHVQPHVKQQEQLVPEAYQQGNPVPYYPVYQLSRWEKVRSWTSSALVVAAITYAGYHCYRNYIKPLILGQTASEKRLKVLETKMQEIQVETNETMKQIQDMLKSIQSLITQQISNSEQTSIKQHDINSIGEIKTEIQSLKGLLLNRRQFPPVPCTSPVLPSWQLTPSNSATCQNTEESSADNQKEELSVSTESTNNDGSSNTEKELLQDDNLINSPSDQHKDVIQKEIIGDNNSSTVTLAD